MEKEIFEKDFIQKLNQNYSEFSKYFEFNLKAFTEFNTIFFEINKCLILDLNRAAITLTNNLLERLLKVALIKNKTGIGPIPIEEQDLTYKGPTEKYGKLTLGNSIEVCKKLKLIDNKEKKILFDLIREMIRNGFAHADFDKVLTDFPDEVKMYQGSFSNPSDIKEVRINQKLNPEIQAFQVENFARENAKYYFDFVFNLVFRIEHRLMEKFK